MIVRSVRGAMLPPIVLFGGGAWLFLTNAGDPSIYTDHYNGKGALVGLLVDATRSYEIYGLNPVMLGLCIFCLVAVILSARKLITGVSARVEQDIVEIPGLFSTKSIAIADIAGVDCKPIGFGEVSSITIVMIDGSRKYIGGANPSDASKFAEFIRLKFPASPTNPQAT